MATLSNVRFQARITPDDEGIHVEAHVTGIALDRPHTMGWLLDRSHATLAARLCRAIEAGAVLKPRSVLTDCFGKTYLDTQCMVLGRKLNADLRRLGF